MVVYISAAADGPQCPIYAQFLNFQICSEPLGPECIWPLSYVQYVMATELIGKSRSTTRGQMGWYMIGMLPDLYTSQY